MTELKNQLIRELYRVTEGDERDLKSWYKSLETPQEQKEFLDVFIERLNACREDSPEQDWTAALVIITTALELPLKNRFLEEAIMGLEPEYAPDDWLKMMIAMQRDMYINMYLGSFYGS